MWPYIVIPTLLNRSSEIGLSDQEPGRNHIHQCPRLTGSPIADATEPAPVPLNHNVRGSTMSPEKWQQEVFIC